MRIFPPISRQITKTAVYYKEFMRLVFSFLLQWIATSIGLWLEVHLFENSAETYDMNAVLGTFLTAGFVLALVNIFIKPIISLISLPITVITLGLFTLVVNGFMVWLALQITDGSEMSFFDAMLAGIVIGVVNFIIGLVAGAMKSGGSGE